MKSVIVSTVRTPIGNFGGTLRTVPAYDLAAIVLNEAIERADLKPESVDIVIMGQNYQNGEYVNIARMGLLTAGWPVDIVGITNDRRCPSGLDAICLASMAIESGNAAIVVAGGVESMSTAEFYIKGDIRWGMGGSGDMPKGHGSLTTWGMPLYDRALRGRVMSQPEERFGIVSSMMTWAEAAATEHGITREEVDSWALLSNQRACAAIESGLFKGEIVSVPVPQRKGEPLLFSQDERPRADTTIDALAKLKPVMGGVCTAGNSCGENDGASACVIMSEKEAEKYQLQSNAYLKGFAFSGSDPRYAWRAATSAVKKVFQKTGLSLKDMDLIEIHEAFAAQALANFRELGLSEKDYDRINVNGSCVSLGHPLGATGARIMTTLTHEMRRRDARYGLIAMCGGGGMGVASIIEKI
ncbi:MAG: acetyl-CoA C-acyltransferase [Desulfatiglandaceae bacterium]|jgi:acetyl-CoA C-acetyltransferase